MSPLPENRNGESNKDLQESSAADVAPLIARRSETGPAADAATTPDLAEVIAAWPSLPEPIKAGILALVKATGTAGQASGRE